MLSQIQPNLTQISSIKTIKNVRSNRTVLLVLPKQEVSFFLDKIISGEYYSRITSTVRYGTVRYGKITEYQLPYESINIFVHILRFRNISTSDIILSISTYIWNTKIETFEKNLTTVPGTDNPMIDTVCTVQSTEIITGTIMMDLFSN